MAPPAFAEFPLNRELIIDGVHPVKFSIPPPTPPAIAELPEKIQLVIKGEELPELTIPPPKKAAFSTKRQLLIVWLQSVLFDIPPPKKFSLFPPVIVNPSINVLLFNPELFMTSKLLFARVLSPSISPLSVVTLVSQSRCAITGLPVFGKPPYMATPLTIEKEIPRSIPVVGLYVPSATHI